MANSRIRTTRTVGASKGANVQFCHLKRVLKAQSVTIGASGGATDRATISLAGFGITKYHVDAVRIFARSATGTLAVGQVGLFTAAAAGGTGIVAAATLATLTAAQKMQASTIVAHDAQTAQTLYIHQSVNSSNAGVVDVLVEIYDLSDQD